MGRAKKPQTPTTAGIEVPTATAGSAQASEQSALSPGATSRRQVLQAAATLGVATMGAGAFGACAAGATAQTTAAAGTQASSPSQVNKAVVQQFFDAFVNGRNQESADTIFTENHVGGCQIQVGMAALQGAQQSPGPAGMKQAYEPFFVAFKDAQWHVDQLLEAEGNRVVALWTARGTHTGVLAGIAPTEKQVTVSGVYVFRFQDGKIAETTLFWDTLGIYLQIGGRPAQ
jgi:steroid delta-isomerase-like uncharacterized protein